MGSTRDSRNQKIYIIEHIGFVNGDVEVTYSYDNPPPKQSKESYKNHKPKSKQTVLPILIKLKYPFLTKHMLFDVCRALGVRCGQVNTQLRRYEDAKVVMEDPRLLEVMKPYLAREAVRAEIERKKQERIMREMRRELEITRILSDPLTSLAHEGRAKRTAIEKHLLKKINEKWFGPNPESAKSLAVVGEGVK